MSAQSVAMGEDSYSEVLAALRSKEITEILLQDSGQSLEYWFVAINEAGAADCCEIEAVREGSRLILTPIAYDEIG